MVGRAESKYFSVFCYLFIPISFVWYISDDLMSRNSFAKYHYKQGLVLWTIFVLLIVISKVLLFFIPYIQSVICLAMFIFVLIGIFHVVNNELKELPVIGVQAKRLKF
jgi:uncharacterized membrane protein